MESKMLEAAGTVRWQDASFVAEVNARPMVSAKPNPIEELRPWFKSVRLYHETETQQIPRGATCEQQRQTQDHRLSVLIHVGEWLVREFRQDGAPGNLGVAIENVEAALGEF